MDFETAWLQLNRTDENLYSDGSGEILVRFFIDVDAFCADPSIRGQDDLDEKQLKESAVLALQKLKRYWL